MKALPIHTRCTLAGDGTPHDVRLVCCPTEGRWTSAEACSRCGESEGAVGPEHVGCRRGATRKRPAAMAPVTEAMESRVLCVSEKTRVEAVADGLGTGSLAVVVDGAGHPVGVCTRADLVGASPGATVETRMTPFVITLVEQATVADAVELILDRGLHHIPVLSEGRVLGVVSPASALRWVVRR